MPYTDAWKFLAGLGLFLYGMGQLEMVLKTVSGRSLKLFLKRNTQNLFKSIVGSAIITGIVQSSSVVSLIVLAFVESGIITFRNAMGVILGTNLGTTLDSWIVASIGFKLDIDSYALSIIAITSICMFFFQKRKKLYNLFAVFFALGILFLGLGYMKDGAMELVKGVDLKSYSAYGTFVFVIIGFIITTIIQSSSATVAITLTAIYSGVLDFPSAAAMVIGSEIGTSIKLLLLGSKGSADKKRVAYGNFYYNIFTAAIAYIFMHWIIYVIEQYIGIQDHLIGLVFFQTTINTLSIVLFVPFLNIFSKWLEKRFQSEHDRHNSYISDNLPVLPVIAIDALRNEVHQLLNKSRKFSRQLLNFEAPANQGLFDNLKALAQTPVNIEEEYYKLKQTEGDILEYHTLILENNPGKQDSNLMQLYVNAGRQSVYAAKAIKDIAHNLKEFNASANEILFGQCQLIQDEWMAFEAVLKTILESVKKEDLSVLVQQSYNDALLLEEQHRKKVMTQLKAGELNEIDASTVLNVYRAMFSCKKSLLSAIGNLDSEAVLQQPYNL